MKTVMTLMLMVTIISIKINQRTYTLLITIASRDIASNNKDINKKRPLAKLTL